MKRRNRAAPLRIIASADGGLKFSPRPVRMPDPRTLDTAKKIDSYMRGFWEPEIVECAWTIPLDVRSRPLFTRPVLVGLGGITSIHFDWTVVFASALLAGAPRIIIVHNHPSGSLIVSKEDRRMTADADRAGQAVGILVYASAVVAREGCAFIPMGGKHAKKS
jgi:DNA repair protein RadC